MSGRDRKPVEQPRFPVGAFQAFKRSRAMKRACASIAILLLLGDLALAQGPAGYAPGVNPSNPQDMTNRGNPQDMTLPGANNPQNLVRSPAPLRALSPGPAHDFGAGPLLSSSLGQTYTVKPAKKFVRRKHRISTPEGQ
jgi:hypothetical protein